MSELTVRLQPSRQLAAFLVATHVLAGGAVWFSALSWWLCLLIDAAVVASFVWSFRQHCRVSIRHLHHSEGQWRLVWQGGEEPLALIGEYLVTPWLLVLRFKTAAGRSRTLVLPPDSATPDDLRRLRVLLRFGLPAG